MRKVFNLPDWAVLVFAPWAVYRVARMVAMEEGPLRVFQWLRQWAGVYDLDKTGEPKSNLGRGVSCPLCVGVWVSAGVCALLGYRTRIGDFVLIWLGLAGLQTWLTVKES